MRALVNYSLMEKSYIPLLAHALRTHGVQAASTSSTLTLTQLQEKATQINADVILLINPDTLSNLTGEAKASLDSYRGSRLNYKIPVLVLAPLAHLVTKKEGEWLYHQDLNKLKTLHKTAEPFSFTVLDSVEKFAPVLKVMSESILMSLDTETSFLNDEKDSIEAGDTIIDCCGWSVLHPTMGIQTFVLPLVTFGDDYWRSNAEYAEAIAFMRSANALPVPKVMQNGMYDSTHLIRYHAEPLNWQLDTMGMQHATYSELPKDLSFLSSLHLYDHVHWKENLSAAKKNKDSYQFWTYNAQDCFRTLRIAIEQLRTMPVYAKKNYGMTFKLVYPCLYCSFEGILIDNKEREALQKAAEERQQEALAKLRIMFDDPAFNPGSWQQVAMYVYDVFGAKKPKIGKSASCTDEKNLIAVGEQHPILAKITQEILQYRENAKAIGTYFSFKQKNSRLLYSLDPFGTETGRMAARSSSMWCGTQVQNIPGYAKGMLVADEGNVICEIDNKQSEARCTAYLAKETALIAALESPTHDFYKTLGTLFFSIPYEEVSDFFRNKVLKRVVHGTNYMMGANTFIENISIPVLFEAASKMGLTLTDVPQRGNQKQKTVKQFATDLLEVYHKPFPRVREWYKELYEEILATGMLTSPNGYTRKFFGNIAKDHQMLRGAVAHQPQNLSVMILNVGFWRCYQELVVPSNGEYRLKAQVHDSILSQFPEERKEYWAKRQQALMDNPIVIHGRTLSIPTDAAVGKNWSKQALAGL